MAHTLSLLIGYSGAVAAGASVGYILARVHFSWREWPRLPIPECKGGQNPSNESAWRPPPPVGSSGIEPPGRRAPMPPKPPPLKPVTYCHGRTVPD